MPTPGPLELVIILVIALLILGPGRLPDVGSALGKSIREFRKASSDIQESVKVDTSPLPATPPAATVAPAAAAAAVAAAAPVAADAGRRGPASRTSGRVAAGRRDARLRPPRRERARHGPVQRADAGHATRPPGPTAPMADADALRDPGVPVPVIPEPAPPAAAPGDDIGHVARRPPR